MSQYENPESVRDQYGVHQSVDIEKDPVVLGEKEGEWMAAKRALNPKEWR